MAILGFVYSTDDLVEDVFGTSISATDSASLLGKVILCPTNDEALVLNMMVLDRLEGASKVYTSIDRIRCDNGEDPSEFPEEFLYSLTPNGMPPHLLTLKAGAVVILLRNLNVGGGLCNGTRLIIRRMHDHLLECELMSGPSSGNTVFIPRVDLVPSDAFLPFSFSRRQFPVRLAFAMTINKAQGQTFAKVGLYLLHPVFSHGQLYVGFSRVRNLASIRVQLPPGTTKTKNVVFREIL
jgi:hypothetical protein